jgi:anthranilate phosphoribosyltransferase
VDETNDPSPVRWPVVLDGLLAGRDLSEDQAAQVLGTIMRGETEASQVAGLLVALRAKGEAPAEIAGFVRAMLAAATPIDVEGPLLDTCGTGGDGAGTFNVSTVAALVVAAGGAPVAKHGNRAASGRCGSADLLEAWGVAIDLPAAGAATTIRELGIGFLYARTFHPAMRHVAPVRAQLGVRTVFNVLGPLSNPAGAAHQVVGVADPRLAPVMADALVRLGKRHALVFRGDDGLDELTTTGPSTVWEIRDGAVERWTIDPADLGVPRATLADLTGGGVEENVRIADAILRGEPGPPADLVALNAAAGLYAADVVPDLASGLARAREVLEGGAAADLRDRWVVRSQELATR